MKYTLQLKTGDAEIRALKFIPHEIYKKDGFALFVELTRGRKSKKDEIGDFNKRVKSLKDFLPSQTKIFFDITSDPNLSNNQIDELFNTADGYRCWQNLFYDLKDHFVNSVPMLIYNDEDKDYDNFKVQIETFARTYNKIGYKIYPSLSHDIISTELQIIAGIIVSYPATELFVFYDQGYIVDGLVKIAEERATHCIGIASGLLQNIENVNYILASTSFPDSVTTLSGKTSGVIDCSEVPLFHTVQAGVNPIQLIYSDYGSITPKRNDVAAFYSRGWVPRIDVPTDDSKIFYYRRRKETLDYADVYTLVAKECIKDNRFPKIDCWGAETIKNAANGMKPGSTPSFWLSVRMNIFIYQQLIRNNIL